jgi:hypothetical protein
MHPDNIGQQFGSSEYFRKVSEGTQPPALFATAKEIWHNTYPGDLDAPYSQENSQGEKEDHWHDSKEDLLQHKLTAKPSLTSSIARTGYHWAHNVMTGSHVSLRNDVLMDGHHRVAAMLKHHPDEFLPIKTTE